MCILPCKHQPSRICHSVDVLLQMASLGTAYTLMVSQALYLAMFALGSTYPHCTGSSWRQAVAPACILFFMLVLFLDILMPHTIGHDLFAMSTCPFTFRLALSGFLLLQFVVAATVQVIAIWYKPGEA